MQGFIWQPDDALAEAKGLLFCDDWHCVRKVAAEIPARLLNSQHAGQMNDCAVSQVNIGKD